MTLEEEEINTAIWSFFDGVQFELKLVKEYSFI